MILKLRVRNSAKNIEGLVSTFLVVQPCRICLQCRRTKRLGLDAWVRKIPWRRKWQPTPVFLLGKSYTQRNLMGYSLSGPKGVRYESLNYNFMVIDSPEIDIVEVPFQFLSFEHFSYLFQLALTFPALRSSNHRSIHEFYCLKSYLALALALFLLYFGGNVMWERVRVSIFFFLI